MKEGGRVVQERFVRAFEQKKTNNKKQQTNNRDLKPIELTCKQ